MADSMYVDENSIGLNLGPDSMDFDPYASFEDLDGFVDILLSENGLLDFVEGNPTNLPNLLLHETLQEDQPPSPHFLQDAERLGKFQSLDEAYRPPNRVNDQFIDQPQFEYRWVPHIERVNEGAPRPEDHVQTIEQFSIVPAIDREEHEANSWSRTCSKPEVIPNSIAFTGKEGPPTFPVVRQTLPLATPIDGDETLEDGGWEDAQSCAAVHGNVFPALHQVTTTAVNRSVRKPRFRNTSGRYVCAECIFANKTAECDGSKDSPCSRCSRLVRRAYATLKPDTDRVAQTLSVPHVVLFDLRETQTLLVELRQEIDDISFKGHWTNLEQCFHQQGYILCHFDEGSIYTPSSATSSTIVLDKLATTARASVTQSNPGKYVEPALAPAQLDVFSDARAPRTHIERLPGLDRSIVTTAWRCAYYLGMLFNWNAHLVYYDSFSLRGINTPLAKNLILEVMYGLAYRIQELVSMLFYLVNESFFSPQANQDYDPATVLCALRILYSSVKKFRELSADYGGIVKLKDFLEGLRSRAGAAISVIQRYRHQKLGLCCRESQALDILLDLIEDATAERSMVNIAFERFNPDNPQPYAIDSGTSHSYTQILACPVPLIHDRDLLLGYISRQPNGQPDGRTQGQDALRENSYRRKRCRASDATPPDDPPAQLTDKTTLDDSADLDEYIFVDRSVQWL